MAALLLNWRAQLRLQEVFWGNCVPVPEQARSFQNIISEIASLPTTFSLPDIRDTAVIKRPGHMGCITQSNEDSQGLKVERFPHALIFPYFLTKG